MSARQQRQRPVTQRQGIDAGLEASEGFGPVSRRDARMLILGSLPGRRSIREQQYYAHPRNSFWTIMKALFGVQGSYPDRLAQLLEKRIALWDVLGRSLRLGSLDANINLDGARLNDFDAFLRAHPDIQLIAFNGKKAEQLFARFVVTSPKFQGIRCAGLPSTSPAYAAMSFSVKLERWRDALESAVDTFESGVDDDRVRNTGNQQVR